MHFFVPGDFDIWLLTLTFKLLRAREQTRLPCEFGANPFSGSRDISYTNKTRKAASDVRTARRKFQATGQPVSRTQASDAMTSRCRTMRRSVCNAGASNAGRSLCVQMSRERRYPLPIYWYHSKGNWLRYNFVADSFYIMKLCSRRFVLYCRNCPKDDKFR